MNIGDQQKVIDSSTPVTEAGCWLWDKSTNGVGYGDLSIRGKHILAHRFSFAAFKGEIPKGLHILHKCDTRLCVNPEHLFCGTNAENIADSMAKGRRKGVRRNRPSGLTYKPQKEGANLCRMKVDRRLIPDLAKRRSNGETYAQIAKDFDCVPSLISRLIKEFSVR